MALNAILRYFDGVKEAVRTLKYPIVDAAFRDEDGKVRAVVGGREWLLVGEGGGPEDNRQPIIPNHPYSQILGRFRLETSGMSTDCFAYLPFTRVMEYGGWSNIPR